VEGSRDLNRSNVGTIITIAGNIKDTIQRCGIRSRGNTILAIRYVGDTTPKKGRWMHVQQK